MTASYVRGLTGAACCRRVHGPVYNVGGAFAQFVLQKYGTERFLRWYFACRPGRVEEECSAQLGVEFDDLESAFWAEARSFSQMTRNTKREYSRSFYGRKRG